MEKTRFKGAVFATASALLYGLGAALIKLATKESLSVATLLVGRGGCGMLLLLLAGCIRRKPPAVKLRSLPKIALYGVFGTVATQIFLNLAYLYLPVGTVTTIHFMYPALVAVMEAVLFRQKLPGTTIITLAVLTISMGLLLENVTAGAERGLLFAVLSVLTWTFQLLYMERSGILEAEDRQTLTFYICLLMAVVGLIYGALTATLQLRSVLTNFGIIALIAFLNNVCATVFLQYGVQYAGAGLCAILSVFEPLGSIVIGAILLHEQLTLRQMLSCVLILGSVCFLIVSSARRERTKGSMQ